MKEFDAYLRLAIATLDTRNSNCLSLLFGIWGRALLARILGSRSDRLPSVWRVHTVGVVLTDQ